VNDSGITIDDLEGALYAAKLASYAQGFLLMEAAARENGWDLNFSEIAGIWRGGCIIRSSFLNDVAGAFAQKPPPSNLFLAPAFAESLALCDGAWRRTVAAAVTAGIPVPAMSSGLSWVDAFRSPRLPAALIQAQRDCFGAHGYERTDRPRGEFFHSDWAGEPV
jgi:6-phosphogluconate dehydrogenase